MCEKGELILGSLRYMYSLEACLSACLFSGTGLLILVCIFKYVHTLGNPFKHSMDSISNINCLALSNLPGIYLSILVSQALANQKPDSDYKNNLPTMRKSSLNKTVGSKVYAVDSRVNPSMASMHPRKVEGKDVLSSTVKSNFVNTVMDLKNRQTNKSTEQQYIGGLQDQIKFLEYELKLLKDKEQFQREGIHELDNFLKDEIPINENILAMKNKYNNTKLTMEGQFKKLSSEEIEAKKVMAIQKQEINRLNGQISNHLSQAKDRQMSFKGKMSEFAQGMTKLQSEYELLLDDSKKKQQELKKMNEEMQQIGRQNEKAKVAQIRKDDEGMKKIFKMIGDFMDHQQSFITSIIKIEELSSYDDKNPLVGSLEDQNISIKKRLMINQKQKNTHQNRIAEISLFLDERSRDRQFQRQQKQKMLDKIFDIKGEINIIDKDIDQLVKVQLNQHKSYKIKSMTNNIEEKKRLVVFFNDRLKKLEQQCENLIQDKKELSNNVEYQKISIKEKKGKTAELAERLLKYKASLDGSRKYKEIVQKQIVPLKTECQKISMRIPLVQKDIGQKKQQLEYMAKQIQLVKELRSLNLQEMKMIATGGNQIQNSLGNFIKKWEKIKTMSQPI